jgi:hypothetical protein
VWLRIGRVVPRSTSLLLRAARTHKREDRLTELLAVVLAGHRDFAHRLLRAAGLRGRGEVDVSTQVRTARGKFVDMQLLSLDHDGTVVGRLWSEHKTGSAYSPGQLPGYAEDLDRMNGPRQLITVVDRLDEAPPSPDWERFTWRQIAVLAWEAGREAAGPNWREAALAPDGPARQWLLLELLSYLEEEHKTVVDPLTHVHVAAFANTSQTHEILFALLEIVGELSAHDPDGVDYPADYLNHYWQPFKADGTWAQPLDGNFELTLLETDEWTYNRAGEPAFGAGFTLPGDLKDTLRSTAQQPWREELEAEGFTIGGWDDWLHVYRTMYLAELIAKGPTIDAQAQALAWWTDESFAIVAGHDPKVTWTPPVKKSRAKATSRTEQATGGDAPDGAPAV